MSYSLVGFFCVTRRVLPWPMTDKPSFSGTDTLVDLGTRLLTPVVREIYAVLVQVGVVVVDD